MRSCDGWIDRDEFDLFLSRIRDQREINWAIRCIRDFRDIDANNREILLNEVRRRIPRGKIYQNWRDMGLHTFSLLGLGTSAIRQGAQLVLAANGIIPIPREIDRRQITLQIPQPTASQELNTPPSYPEPSSGTDGELLVGKLLEANDWEVVFYSNRRGFGFDIWARRENAAILVEVKSSLRRLGRIILTRLEYEAAIKHRENYFLVTVEGLGRDDPIINFIQDPASVIGSQIERRRTEEYHIPRRAWADVAEPFLS
ncbi:DUF3883 domain-containing protein [Nitrospinae bacterium AH-259-F20]|nr:DUF3883 domain-containing protein [Nitrospinae bacterium AH-259-F20]